MSPLPDQWCSTLTRRIPSPLYLYLYVHNRADHWSPTNLYPQIKGKIITGSGSGDACIFLNHSHPLWSKAMGDPRSPSDVRHSGKLVGTYSWPFSITLPKKVALQPTPGSPTQSYRLPQTFVERYTRVSIQYELVVNIVRTKLRADSK
jgi:hypothetical protein